MGLIPFRWSDDRNSSYVSFTECLTDWEEAAAQDVTIDLNSDFNLSSLNVTNVEGGAIIVEAVHENINMFASIED